MIIAEFLGTNDTVEIRLHKFLHEINLVKLMDAGWLQDIKNRDDVFMMKVSK